MGKLVSYQTNNIFQQFYNSGRYSKIFCIFQDLFLIKPIGILSLLDEESHFPKVRKFSGLLINCVIKYTIIVLFSFTYWKSSEHTCVCWFKQESMTVIWDLVDVSYSFAGYRPVSSGKIEHPLWWEQLLWKITSWKI